MFRHPHVTKVRKSVEIDDVGRWVYFFEITVNMPIADQNAVADVMQKVVDWAAQSNVGWDKLRIVEG